MVDVDGVVEVGVEVNRRAADEIPTTVFHEQGGQPLVGGCEAALQRQQARRREVGVAHRARFAAAFDPGDHILDVHAKTGFVGATVQFTRTPLQYQRSSFCLTPCCVVRSAK